LLDTDQTVAPGISVGISSASVRACCIQSNSPPRTTAWG